jgi:heme/copper-type cytochrome/quinol oxidase subunit 2
MSGSLGIAIAGLLLFVVIPLSIGFAFFYFVRRYLRKKFQGKDLGFKYKVIVGVIPWMVIIIVLVLFGILPIFLRS